MYIYNPKFEGSGIIGCIPQTGKCPNNCEDCFFQSGRSYLEPLEQNLPNIPDIEIVLKNNYIVKVNDGNDSNSQRNLVIENTKQFPLKFYNTAIPYKLQEFNNPVVLTLNPGKLTDIGFHKLETIPTNLMFVRFRTNTWNLHIAKEAVEYYTSRKVPVVLTFMAYFVGASKIPFFHRHNYIYRKRINNEYYAITTKAWNKVMNKFRDNYLVYSCGHVEGEKGNTRCRYCGNCLREFYATLWRMKNNNSN